MYYPIHYVGQAPAEYTPQQALGDFQREMLWVYGGLVIGVVAGMLIWPQHRILGGIVGAALGSVTGAMAGIATTPQLAGGTSSS